MVKITSRNKDLWVKKNFKVVEYSLRSAKEQLDVNSEWQGLLIMNEHELQVKKLTNPTRTNDKNYPFRS